MATCLLTGVAWTDEQGYARVALPPYLCRTAPKFRFELIPKKSRARACLVTRLPADELTIHTDLPHAKVTWAAIPEHIHWRPTPTQRREER